MRECVTLQSSPVRTNTDGAQSLGYKPNKDKTQTFDEPLCPFHVIA